MTISISITVLLVFSLTSVTCQHSAQAFIGGNVTLPCFYNKSQPVETSIYWRDKDDGVILDIKKGSASYDHQHEKYKDRVSSFSKLYHKGNFSIIFKNVQKNDADTYKCHVKGVKDPIKVSLTVLDKPAAHEATNEATNEAAGGAAGGTSGGAAGLNLLQVALLSPLCLLLCF